MRLLPRRSGCCVPGEWCHWTRWLWSWLRRRRRHHPRRRGADNAARRMPGAAVGGQGTDVHVLGLHQSRTCRRQRYYQPHLVDHPQSVSETVCHGQCPRAPPLRPLLASATTTLICGGPVVPVRVPALVPLHVWVYRQAMAVLLLTAPVLRRLRLSGPAPCRTDLEPRQPSGFRPWGPSRAWQQSGL